jgi:AcrR family transcriptional regulator
MTTPAQRLTPRKTPVQHRSVETRARILDAAARVFSGHGYAAGTTNRIAAEARLSVGSLYQYFPNKDSILVELVRRHLQDGAARVTARLAAVDDGAPDRTRRLVAAAIDATIDNHVHDPGLHQVLFEESPRPPELLAELHAAERTAIDLAATILAADPDVQVADPVMAARVVVTTIESVVHRVVAARDRIVDIATFRHELVTMIERYLFAGPASPAGFLRPASG